MDDLKAAAGFGDAAARRVLDQAQYSISIADPSVEDCPLVYVNRAFTLLTGYSETDCLGRNCRFLQGEDTDPAACATLREAVEHGREATVTLKNYRAGGAPFWNQLGIAPVRDDEGTIVYVIGIQREVAAPDERHSDTMLRELQHRVKNHLAMIVSLVRVEARESERAADYQPSARLNRLVGRIESLQLLYDQLNGRGGGETVDFAAYLSQLTASLTALAERPSVRIEIRAETCVLDVETAARLGLAVSELVTNALKHAFPDGRPGIVEVALRRRGGNVMRLSVTDDGIGMTGGLDTTAGIGGRLVKGLLAREDVAFEQEGVAEGTAFRIDFADEAELGTIPASGAHAASGRPPPPVPPEQGD
ncbi:MAG: PAS domain-containing protein [Paracoccaceae bacterium]